VQKKSPWLPRPLQSETRNSCREIRLSRFISPDWPLAEEIPRLYLYVILIKQVETGGTGANMQRSLFNSRSLELGRGAMHGFDCFVRRIIGRISGLK
jgi:hypothetical protein